MVARVGDVVKKLDLASKYRNDHIHAAIVVEIAESSAAVGRFQLEIWPGRSADLLELPVSKIAEYRI